MARVLRRFQAPVPARKHGGGGGGGKCALRSTPDQVEEWELLSVFLGREVVPCPMGGESSIAHACKQAV